jgi:hypothetical protein
MQQNLAGALTRSLPHARRPGPVANIDYLHSVPPIRRISIIAANFHVADLGVSSVKADSRCRAGIGNVDDFHASARAEECEIR